MTTDEKLEKAIETLEKFRKQVVPIMKKLMLDSGRDGLLMADALHRVDNEARITLNLISKKD